MKRVAARSIRRTRHPRFRLCWVRDSASLHLSRQIDISMELRAMEQSAISRIFVGPHGIHAFGFIVLALFLAFLWAFNFTGFF
jgi:hypothetical protein